MIECRYRQVQASEKVIGMLRRYRRRADTVVMAIRLDLDTDGFTYLKWGAEQRCKGGDWLVDNGGDIYTVDKVTFARTYRMVEANRYVKHTSVWAEVSSSDDAIETKEGLTHYQKGDYLVFNEPERTDGYAVSAEIFHSLYELDDGT